MKNVLKNCVMIYFNFLNIPPSPPPACACISIILKMYFLQLCFNFPCENIVQCPVLSLFFFEDLRMVNKNIKNAYEVPYISLSTLILLSNGG